jgi:hypothetical protein
MSLQMTAVEFAKNSLGDLVALCEQCGQTNYYTFESLKDRINNLKNGGYDYEGEMYILTEMNRIKKSGNVDSFPLLDTRKVSKQYDKLMIPDITFPETDHLGITKYDFGFKII